MDPDSPADELEHAHDVFARALHFLSRSAEDPAAARASEDPQALVRDLKALSSAPLPPAGTPAEAEAGEPEEKPAPQSLPLRRRRSA